MPGVITVGSNVTCGHAGTVATTGQAKLTINGNQVLLKDGILGKDVSSCATVAAADVSGPTAKPCLKVSAVNSGEATKLTIDGRPVMLETLAGTTDGMVTKVTPQPLLAAMANQMKLTAV